MSKELVVSATRHETRVAVLEEDSLVEIFYQREKEYSLAGSIHKGRVTRVLPGMQSAFVDIGLERDAFLYVSDFFEDNDEYDKIVTGVEEKVARLEKGLPIAAEPVMSVESAEEPAVATSLAVPSSSPGTFGRPRDDRPRDDRQRGGRGRRRGRRGSERPSGPRETGGLPESKYFSPRDMAAEESKEGGDEAPSASRDEYTPSPEEIVVLPGESLAKYIADPVAPVTREEVEELQLEPDPQMQNAVQETSDVVLTPGIIQMQSVLELNRAELREMIDHEIDAHPATEEGDGIHAEAEEIEAEQEFAAQEDEEESEEPESVEIFVSEETIVFASEESLEEEAPGEIETAEATEAEDEGPEPARIPTSLTATLREQNPRFQRVSRRMRRKPREGGGGERPVAAVEEKSAPREREERARPPLPSISELLREGQEIIVQIAKEPIGQKGARITSHVALPGRFLVYMPSVDHIGVSRKIPSEDERSRLKRVLQTHRTGIPGGYIVRTAGDGRTEEELRADMMFLYNLWLDMRQKAEKRPAPQLMHHDLDVVQRILRDQLTSAFKTVWVDNEILYESILSFVQRFQPTLVSRVKLYTRPTPIFDEFGITSELEKALRPKVWLKSGGYIVINQTEALVAIDINTGKFVGKSNRLEDTIVKTNTDAIKEIVRQIRLRDLGGIIVIDFIDMDDRKNRQKVMLALEEAMRVDRAPYKILQFNDFGLVAITRKRVKQSLERTLCTPCTYCEGAGSIKSVQTVITEILMEAHKLAKVLENDVMLRVHPEVAKVLKSNQNDFLQEIEETLGKTVMVKSDPLLHQTKFDLA